MIAEGREGLLVKDDSALQPAQQVEQRGLAGA
jgi:hypothetical protein